MDVPRYPVSVKAIVERDGRFLFILKRLPNGRTVYGLPGGLKEPGETLEEALKREVREEVGLEVEPVAVVGASTYVHHLGGEKVVIYFLVRVVGGSIKLRSEPDTQFLGYKWLSAKDLDVLEPESYRNFMKELLHKLSSQHV